MSDKRLAVGAATNWAAFAAALAVAFFMFPYQTAGLGKERAGVWIVAESILAYFTLFDLGIAACLVRFVARHEAKNDQVSLNKIVSASFVLFTVAAGGVLLVGAVLAPFAGAGLERKLAAEGAPAGDVTAFLLLMLANLALTLPLSVFTNILDGLQRYVAKSVVRLVFLGVRVGGSVYVIETRPGLFPLAVVFTITNLLEHAVMAALSFRYLPGLRISRGLVDRATLKDVKGYSVDAFLAMLAGRITVQTAAIVVGGFMAIGAVAYYGTAMRLVEMAKNMLRAATTTLTPAVSEREARGDLDGVRRVLLVGTRWVLYLVLPIHLGLLFFGKPFIERYMKGQDFAGQSFPVLVILSATLTIGVAQSVASRILYGMGKLRLFARLALVEAVVNLTLCLLLVKPFGLVGVAVAVGVPNVLFCLFVIGYACRQLDVPMRQYLAAWVRPVCAAAAAAGVWAFVTPVAAAWPAIGAGIAAGLVPFAVVVIVVERIAVVRPTPTSPPPVPAVHPA